MVSDGPIIRRIAKQLELFEDIGISYNGCGTIWIGMPDHIVNRIWIGTVVIIDNEVVIESGSEGINIPLADPDLLDRVVEAVINMKEKSQGIYQGYGRY